MINDDRFRVNLLKHLLCLFVAFLHSDVCEFIQDFTQVVDQARLALSKRGTPLIYHQLAIVVHHLFIWRNDGT